MQRHAWVVAVLGVGRAVAAPDEITLGSASTRRPPWKPPGSVYVRAHAGAVVDDCTID